MLSSNVFPLMDIELHPWLASLPKADLHLHQEEIPRLERIIALRQGRSPYDWRRWAQHLMENVPAGMNRLQGMYTPDATFALDQMGDNTEFIIAKIADVLEEEAADGAILAEIRFGIGGQAVTRPDFMTLFREAERQVQSHYPYFYAEAIVFLPVSYAPNFLQITESHLELCVQMAKQGLAGIDFLSSPYEREADPAVWKVIAQWAAYAADEGLGITLHAGEFSATNLAAALAIPHLQRIGHAVHTAADPRLLEQLVRSGVTVECSLSCNVILGAVPSYQEHPIKTFVTAGVPVTLNTDDPMRVWTTIGREYAIAEALDFSLIELLGFTRNAICASFTSTSRKADLLDAVEQWQMRYDLRERSPS